MKTDTCTDLIPTWSNITPSGLLAPCGDPELNAARVAGRAMQGMPDARACRTFLSAWLAWSMHRRARAVASANSFSGAADSQCRMLVSIAACTSGHNVWTGPNSSATMFCCQRLWRQHWHLYNPQRWQDLTAEALPPPELMTVCICPCDFA